MTDRPDKAWRAVLASHPLAERSRDAQFWDEYLEQNPDVLHRLLADVYRATYGAEKPPSLEDLWAILDAPEFTGETFGPAVRELASRRGKSLRWVALQAHVDQKHLLRYLSGERPIVNAHDIEGSMERIESVSRALRVHPSYFMEWRRLWVMRLVDSAFTAHPDLSVEVFRRFSGFEPRSRVNARSQEGQ